MYRRPPYSGIKRSAERKGQVRNTGLKKIGIGIMLAALCLTGCGSAQEETASQNTNKVTKEVFAMDTYMTVTTYGEQAENAAKQAVDEIERLDGILSTGDPESEIAIVNENGSEIVSEDTAALIDESLSIYWDTAGAFDISIYPLMNEWGFTTQKYKVPSAGKIRKLLKKVNASRITWDESKRLITLPDDMEIDLGGIAKGYTSDRLMQIFQKNNLTGGVVSLGGNVQAYGTKEDGSEWKIAIENPPTSSLSGDYLGVLQTSGKAVITSGGYERYFEKKGKTYHHILDPSTGYPADSGVISSTIVSDSGVLADGLSTSLFVMGKDKAVEYWKKRSGDFDFVLLLEDGSVWITEGIEDIFSSDFQYEVIHNDK